MSKLLRWEVWVGPQPEIDMENGEWVRYEDAKELEEEVERLRQEVSDQAAIILEQDEMLGFKEAEKDLIKEWFW